MSALTLTNSTTRSEESSRKPVDGYLCKDLHTRSLYRQCPAIPSSAFQTNNSQLNGLQATWGNQSPVVSVLGLLPARAGGRRGGAGCGSGRGLQHIQAIGFKLSALANCN